MMWESWAARRRIDEAKRITKSVVDHTLYLLWLHELNSVVLYTDTLSKQIPKSRAANAFNVFREGMHQIEIVRLCALWDQAKLDREAIPTIVELIDDSDVLSLLVDETRDQYSAVAPATLDDIPDEERPEVAEAVRGIHAKFAEEQAQRADEELKSTIKEARTLRTSDRMRSMRSLRDKKVAHNLAEAAEVGVDQISPMKYGDEGALLDQTLAIVQTLYSRVNGVGFSMKDSRAIDRKCAEALWNSCTFKIDY
jgi:hypothetical protein